MSDRLAVFNHGRIEQVGSPAERLRAAGDPVRRRLRRDVEPARGATSRRRSSARPGRSPSGPRRSASPSPTRTSAADEIVARSAGSGRSSTSVRTPASSSSSTSARELVVTQQNLATSSIGGTRPRRQGCPPHLEAAAQLSPSAAAGTHSAEPDRPARLEEEHGQAEDRRGDRGRGASSSAPVRAAAAVRRSRAHWRRSARRRAL